MVPGTAERHRPPRRRVTVEQVSQLTPRMVRVVTNGALEGWEPGGPGAHFKVFLQSGDERHVMRTYSVRNFDSDAGRLTIDFLLHGEGPASAWARGAHPGETFEVSGRARSGFAPACASGSVVLAGDQAALPAIAAIAESLPPPTRTTVVAEIADDEEEQQLRSSGQLRVYWLHHGNGSPGERLLAAVQALDLPDDQVEVWVGCEAQAMRRIRRHLLEERRLDPSAVHTRAYWRAGIADYPDHDTGED